MSCCWSSWFAGAVIFAILLKYQDRNVEWSRCTRVVLALQWRIYFCWVFGLQLYSLLLDDLKFPDFTSSQEVMPIRKFKGANYPSDEIEKLVKSGYKEVGYIKRSCNWMSRSIRKQEAGAAFLAIRKKFSVGSLGC